MSLLKIAENEEQIVAERIEGIATVINANDDIYELLGHAARLMGLKRDPAKTPQQLIAFAEASEHPSLYAYMKEICGLASDADGKEVCDQAEEMINRAIKEMAAAEIATTAFHTPEQLVGALKKRMDMDFPRHAVQGHSARREM